MLQEIRDLLEELRLAGFRDLNGMEGNGQDGLEWKGRKYFQS